MAVRHAGGAFQNRTPRARVQKGQQSFKRQHQCEDNQQHVCHRNGCLARKTVRAREPRNPQLSRARTRYLLRGAAAAAVPAAPPRMARKKSLFVSSTITSPLLRNVAR